MELRQLEYFRQVVESGSFTRAAAVLGVAQPALSRHIRRLENELQQELLHRNGRGVTPTEAGERMLSHSRGILRQMERAREDLRQLHAGLAGRVVIGLVPSLARTLAVPLIEAFRRQLPRATLSISEGLSAVLGEWLIAGRIDISVLYNPPVVPEMTLVPLATEALCCVGPVDPRAARAPLTLRALAQLPLVVPNPPHVVRALVETQMALIGCRPRIALAIDSVPTILDLVSHRAGYAVLTESAIRTARRPQDYALRRITHPELTLRLNLATMAERPATATQRAVLRLVERTLPGLYPVTTADRA